MAGAQLAAWLDSYRADLRTALHWATQHGYCLVHVNTVRDDLNPRELSGSARRHLRKYLRELGLRLDALAVEYPGLGLTDPAHASERVDRFRQTLELCRDLGVPHTGVRLSGFEDEHTAPLARELLGVVADLADRYGIDAAVNDPQRAPDSSAAEVRALGCPHLRITLDTATLRSTADASSRVVDLVGAVFLRDVRRRGDRFEEVPFGQGEVDFPALLAQLEAAHYPAPLIIRHDAEGGVDALRQGREYMQALVGRFGAR